MSIAASSRRAHRAQLPKAVRQRRVVTFVLIGVCAIAFDFALIVAFISGDLPLPLALAAHVAVSLFVLGSLVRWLEDWPKASLVALWVAFLGPVGALVATLTLRTRGTAKRPSIEDEEWYQRLSGTNLPDDDLVSALKDRRAYRADNVGLRSFREVMDHGTVAQKQTILGLIAQSYEPALSGLLMEALRSDEVAVRASAAAVLARLRDQQSTRLKNAALLAASAGPDDVLTAATMFAEAAASRLLSPSDSEKALAMAASLRHRLNRHDVVPMGLHQLTDQLKRMTGEFTHTKAERSPGVRVSTKGPVPRRAEPSP